MDTKKSTEQIDLGMKNGNDFYYIEAIGDKNIILDVASALYKYGRKQDILIIDFDEDKNSSYKNGINPLSVGNSDDILKLLKNLVDIDLGENCWASDMTIAYMKAILQPLVLLRNLGLMVRSSDLRKISTLDDFKIVETKNFTLNVLIEYLDFQAAIDLLYMMKRLFNNKDFLNLKDVKDVILDDLIEMLNNSNVDIKMESEPDYFKIDSGIRKFNQKSTYPWVSLLTEFSSKKYFGDIFNKEIPNLSISNVG